MLLLLCVYVYVYVFVEVKRRGALGEKTCDDGCICLCFFFFFPQGFVCQEVSRSGCGER